MNLNEHYIEISCNSRNIREVADVLIHSIIFYRTQGKFTYNREDNYSIGSLGFEKIECKKIAFTYVRCKSESLANSVDIEVNEFVRKLSDNTIYALLRLEFYTRKPNRWPFNDSKFVWESWNLKFLLNNQINQQFPSPSSHIPAQGFKRNSYIYRGVTNSHPDASRVEFVLTSKLLDIVTIVNKDRAVLPNMPSLSNLDHVFDTNYSDIQPYLFSLSWRINDNLEKQGGAMDTNHSRDSPRRSSLQKLFLDALEL